MDNRTWLSLARRIRQKREAKCFDEEYFLDVLQVWNEKVRHQSMEELAEMYADAMLDDPLKWEEHISRSQTDSLAWDAIKALLGKVRPLLEGPFPLSVPLARLRSWAFDVALGIRPGPKKGAGGDDRVLRTRNAAIVVTLQHLKDLGTPPSTSNESARAGTGFQLVGERVRREYDSIRDVWRQNKGMLDEPDTVPFYEAAIAGPVALFCLTIVLRGDLERIERIEQAHQAWRQDFSEWFQSTRSPF